MLKPVCGTLLGLCLASSALVPAVAQDTPAVVGPSSVLSLEEFSRASEIAAPQATMQAFQLDPSAGAPGGPDREVVTTVQAVGGGKTSSRRAIVTLYRYNGNVVVNRLIDIDSGTVIQEVRLPNGSAPVADVETEYATTLLRANEQIRQLLATIGNDATFSFRLQQTTDRRNALFGKRVVQVQIRTPNGFVGGLPTILVNLTDGAVIVRG